MDDKKFIEAHKVSDFEVLDDNNQFREITHVLKTVKYPKFRIKTETKDITCADKHLFIEETGGKIYAKDCVPFETKLITDIGSEEVIEVIDLKEEENMYDLSLNSKSTLYNKDDRVFTFASNEYEQSDHTYFTNGIQSHNTGVGKTLFFTHMAADFIRQGYNVVYISAEMSVERIYQRIDANMLDLSMSVLDENPDQKLYFSKIKEIARSKKLGKLWIKEFPPLGANKLHIQQYIKELELKKGFKPDIIILDYLNIFASCRLPAAQASDSYRYVKSVTEELRALAIEENIVAITGTQTNRCLDPETLIQSESRGLIEIKNVLEGEMIRGDGEYVEVLEKFPISEQEVYEITLESGKTITCSAKHIFPTTDGEKCLNSGLKVGDNFFTQHAYNQIKEILNND